MEESKISILAIMADIKIINRLLKRTKLKTEADESHIVATILKFALDFV